MLVLSALVVGSVAPDFRYFLDLGPFGHFSHSIKGAFLFCLPVSLAVLWIFQSVMKLPLISLAPERHQERLAIMAPFRWRPAGRFILIVCSVLLGTFSHIAWDAFTHDRGFVVRNLPKLRTPALEEFGSTRPLYNVLQHGSSLLGMALLIIWYWLWFRRAPQQPPPYLKTARRGWIAASILIIAGSIALADAYVASDHLASRSAFAGTFAVMSMSLVFLEALGFSLWWQWRRKKALSHQHSAFSP